jgi:DNA-binding XRE family transcriptional regulator
MVIKMIRVFRKDDRNIPPHSGINKIHNSKLDHENTILPIPVSPMIHSALRSIYAGGPKNMWGADLYGRPLYKYETKDGHIEFFFAPSQELGNRFQHSIALYYARTRLGFIYYEYLINSVKNLSVETADVFLILMSRIAELKDPKRGIATISLKDIAQLRGVYVRHGSSKNLYEDFKREILRLADMRLTMSWKDYKTGGKVIFGKELPDRLIDIVDIEYENRGERWKSFYFRCGQALAHFLDPNSLRWIGYYSRLLLELSPYQEAFTKKTGTYWTLVGMISGKKGLSARALPTTILNFCGEDINWRNPGHTVDAFFKSMDRLLEIGVITDAHIMEPTNRIKDYFREWLETPMMVTVSQDIWRMQEKAKLPSQRRKTLQKECARQSVKSPAIPESVNELIETPCLIRKFRTDHYLHQTELARAVGVCRQTLSKYERSLISLPADKALKIIKIWQNKAKMDL